MIFNRKKEDLNNKKKSDAIFEEGERLWENKEYEKAVEYYKKAAELGHTKSMLFLAYAYRFGEGTAENSEKALSWYKKAYAAGDKVAAGCIGAMYHYEEVSGATDGEILRLLLEGAAADSKKALIPLTERYYYTQYNNENSKLAAYFAYRAYAADDIYGCYYMGLFYYEGEYFPEVPAYAKFYLEKFIGLGGDIPDAKEMLESDELKKVTAAEPTVKPFDDPLPGDFFDCEDPTKLFLRGRDLVKGYDEDENPVMQDIETGMELLLKAAKQGHSQAQAVVGTHYRQTDRPCPTFFDDGGLDSYRSDPEQYLFWLKSAADKGFIPAIEVLIPCFRYGADGIEKNNQLAEKYSALRLRLTGEPYDDSEDEKAYTGDDVLIKYIGGDSYRGAAVGGVREGFGAYFYADDGYYRGTFHQGVFHGYGIREYGDGHTYKGMWKNDTKNGYGEYTFSDGRSYFGWWKDDCFQGFGCMTLSGGEVYVGEYENHKENGIFLYNRGNKWSGYKAADGKVIGSSAGRWTAYKDGSEYCGPIIERRRGNTIYRVKEGFGEYRFPDDDSECPSDRYQGQFKDDMPYGTGIRLYTSPETDMPIIMASNDFRGDIIPRGHFQSVCGIKDPSGNCDFFLYYVGECKDSVCYGRGVMYVIGTTERSRYTPYGVKGGSIIFCDTFREHPDGPATVINRYEEELHGRFVDGMFEQYK